MSHTAIKQHASILDSAPILSSLSAEAKARLLPMVHEVSLAPGDVLFKLGDPVSDIYLVLEGEVELATQRGVVRVSEAGFIGEEAALGCMKYLASATAKVSVRLLAIAHDALVEPLANAPKLRRDLWFSLSAHLAEKMEPNVAVTENHNLKIGSDVVQSVGWLVTLLLPIAMIMWGENVGLTGQVKMFLAILCATVSMWTFRLVPEFVPGFFAILSIILVGMAPLGVALSGFSSAGFFMAMSVLGLSAVVTTSGLSLRVLLLLLRYTPHNQFCYQLNLLAVGILLTPIVPSANGRIALTTPMLTDMLHTLRGINGSRPATRLSAATFAGSTLFCGVFLSSKSANFVVLSMLSAQLQEQFHWLYWFFAGSVCGIVMLVLYLILSQFMFRNKENLPLSNGVIDLQLKVLGPLSMKEWAAAASVLLFGFAVAMSSVHKVGPAWLALSVLYGLLLFSFLEKDEFQESIDWPFLMFLGGLVGLVNVMFYIGAEKVLGTHMGWTATLMRENLYLFILALSGIVLAMRFVLPINITMVIAATIFLPIASANGINPWFVGFIILTMGDSWFYAYQNSTYLLFKRRSATPYDEGGFMKLNALLTVAKLVGIYVSIPFWRYLGII